jgi:L-ascorbate metabolism protein UlaG (beta-lactamase superfamily)
MQGMKVQALTMISLGLFAAMLNAEGAALQGSTPELSYFGRASVKIKTLSGFVIYIDPYAPGDYSEPADLVLVTHGHSDHNQVRLAKLKDGAIVASPSGAVSVKGAEVMAEGSTLELDSGKLSILALPAANKNHMRTQSVGYLLSFDGIVLYHAGDTDYLPEMEAYADYCIDYALLPCDGFYNMGSAEAARSARAMKARRVVPIHSDASGLFSEKNARAVGDSLGSAGLIVLKPGEKTQLAR